jgi:type II secretory pathway component GspD/PulD (secretin)
MIPQNQPENLFSGWFLFDIPGAGSFNQDMKTKIPIVVLIGTLMIAAAEPSPPATAFKKTFSSFDQPSDHAPADLSPAHSINFQGVDLEQVLKIYGSFSGRTVIHGSLPDAKISFKNDAPVGRVRLLQQLDTLLAQNNIAMVLSGDDAVKAVHVSQINSESPPEIDLPWQSLPDSSSVMTRKVYLKKYKPSEVLSAIQPFTKLPNSILAIDNQKLLIIRDYSANIRQELKLIEEIENRDAK